MLKFIKILSHLLPNTTAQILLNLFLRPKKHKRPKKEQKVWKEGKKIIFPGGIHARLYRPKKEKLVVFLHGWSGRGSQFYKFVESLEDFSVLLIDGPAHGDSKGSITNLPIFTKQITEVLKIYDDRIYAIVGHSFGAMASLISAKFGLKAQKRVLIGSPYQSKKVIEIFCSRFSLHKDTPKRLKQLIEEMAGISIKQIDQHPHFKTKDCALLIVHDEEDKSVPVDRAKSIHNAYPGSKMLITKGLGHYRILFNKRVREEIGRFLKD